MTTIAQKLALPKTVSGYNWFMKTQMAEMKENPLYAGPGGVGARMVEIGKRWKALDKTVQLEWTLLAAKAQVEWTAKAQASIVA